MPAPLLLHVFATFAVGGPQVRFAAIANHFGRRWRHAIVAMDGNTTCRERLDPGLDVTFPAIDIRKGDTLGNVRRFRAALRDWRPRTLVTNNWGSIEWAMANAVLPVVPQIHIEDGFGPEERDRQIPRRVWTRRLALHHCLTVLPSHTLLRIATNIWRLPPERLRHVPNGIDLVRFGAQRRPHGGETVIGTVAALRAEKNIARLIRAFALAAAGTQSRLVIVGDGPERASLEALAAASGVGSRITFAGHLPDPTRAYSGFDIFALSSDTEQMPLTLLEAMAAGLPVAATDVGDVRDLLAEPNRALAVARDDAALAGTLHLLLSDPASRAALGAANRARAAAEFSQERMFDSYASLFDAPPG